MPLADFFGLPLHYGGAVELYAPPTSGTAPNNLPYFNLNQLAFQLNRGGDSWNTTVGTPLTVSYGFRSSSPGNIGLGVSGFATFNPIQIAVTEEVLQLWAEVANITFVRVGSGSSGPAAFSNNATILFGNFLNGGAAFSAFTYLPVPGATGGSQAEGDVWVNVSRDYDADPATFSLGAHILAHEIGHALGFLHPGVYDGGAQGGATYGNDADFYQDTLMFSNMSYFSEANTGGAHGVYAITPMLLDIAAAQRLYGANMTTRTGDTVYGFNGTTGHAAFLITSASQAATFCIWDAGGNDTLDLSGYSTPSEIDLREEAFSSGGPAVTGAAIYNISIARGAVIENAIGGSGNDVLIGNSANNRLDGRTGVDNMTGGAGDDQYIVDNANDVVTELSSAGRDTVYASITYTLGANLEDLALTGAAALNGFGNATANLLVGNSAVNGLDGGAGADFMVGGAGDDLYFFDNMNDIAIESAGEGRDTVYTTVSAQLGDGFIEDLAGLGSVGLGLTGNALSNLIVGTSGNDGINGLGGADFMVGGLGDDLYFFDNAGDVAIESAGQGRDTVYTSVTTQLGDGAIEDLAGLGSVGLGLTGNALDNLIVGTGGVDGINGLGGADFMVGGAGDDLYFVDHIGDVVIESTGEGRDTVYASIHYTLGDGEVEDLALTGVAAINGTGNAQANLIVGNDSANILQGRGGVDALVGGGGADAFVYANTGEGGDQIFDFTAGVDEIVVSASGFGGGLTAGGAAPLVANSNPSSVGASFVYDTDDGRLLWDADGAGGAAAVLVATLTTLPALTSGDIIIGS